MPERLVSFAELLIRSSKSRVLQKPKSWNNDFLMNNFGVFS